jgi:hypothetical protein
MHSIEQIESQVTDDATRQALLTVLKKRLAQLQQANPSDADAVQFTKEKIASLTGSAGSSLEPQLSSTGSNRVGPG